MFNKISRRELLVGSIGLASALRGAKRTGTVVETNAHIYSDDLARFPFHINRTSDPVLNPPERYVRFLKKAGIGPVVIVHPTAYQDDHRSLEYYLSLEPSPGFFKGTCFFDPTDPRTPDRMKQLASRHPGRIVALRIFEESGAAPTKSGTIRNRDLKDPVVKSVLTAAASLGMAIQMNTNPGYAPQTFAIASQSPHINVLLDDFGRPNQGTPQEYDNLLKLFAGLPNVYMKFTTVQLNLSRWPDPDPRLLTRRVFDAFGPDRIMWSQLGNSIEQYQQTLAKFEEVFDFASESDRARIAGLTAIKVFKFNSL
jgi:L-fuconolactonase